MEVEPSRCRWSRAGALAAAFARYRQGGPSQGLALRAVSPAGMEDIDGVGRKYHLKLELEDVHDKGNKNLAPDVQVTLEGELKNTKEADNIFYNRIRSLEKELVAENIPDSHGNVSPELEPVHLLAWVASGYVIWQNSTENTHFQLAQIKHVKQVKRSDEYLQFDYIILLHEMVSQEIIPWQMTVLWHPQHAVQVTQDSCQPQQSLE